MPDNFSGTIIEESLENPQVLKKIKILHTRIEKVTERHKTPWITQWTMHKVEIEEDQAEKIAKELSRSIDPNQPGSWYADFKNSKHHYIVFRGKVFYVNRTSKEQYDKAKEYGLSIGIPAHQVDFHPTVEEWKR